MTDATELDDLARLSFATAGQLHLLAERMQELGRQPDGHEPAELSELANTLRGMAVRCAMSTGNTALLNELTGRSWRPLDGDDPLDHLGNDTTDPDHDHDD